jgi:3-hydroxyisobutyrate dehydrogenase
MTRVLFVGLGQIGRPMALRLTQAGIDTLGYDRAPAAGAAFAAEGGRATNDPAGAAAAADVVITMLPDGRAVEAALFDAPGIAHALRPGTTVIDMSSCNPDGTRRLAATLADRGVTLIDAPVSGGVARARDGTLAIMAGGDAAAIERVRPVLAAIGGTITHVGASGAGHSVKALNNYVSAAGLVAVSEAIHLGMRQGVAPEVLVAVLNASTGRNNTTERKALPFMIPENYAAGFSLALMRKDLGTAAGMAEALGISPPLLGPMAALWREAEGALPDGADHTAMHAFLAGFFRTDPA